MICFPNAKINIGLHVTEKRADGFHNIDSLFYPIPLHDILEVVPAKDRDSLHLSGQKLPGAADDNLVLDALAHIRKKYDIPPLRIYLHKKILAGSGLGGGSSDAAFMLKALNRMFGLEISANELKNMALELGSDCPFFIDNFPVCAGGRGEVMTATPKLLQNSHLLLFLPEIHLSTAEAYAQVRPKKRNKSIEYILQNTPMKEWRKLLSNDFEAHAFTAHPELETLKNRLYESGALYAGMSGSGAAIFGLFTDSPDISSGELHSYKIFKLKL